MKKIILIFYLFAHHFTFAQTEVREQLWTAYFNQAKFSNNISSWMDVQLRTLDEFTGGFSQFLFRPGITYTSPGNVRFTCGYAYIHSFENTEKRIMASDEHRFWQQVSWGQHAGKSRFTQAIRNEMRWRENLPFAGRVRINLLWQHPLNKKAFNKGGIFLVLNDELFINYLGPFTYNIFDQNRAFAGFGYYFNDQLNLQLGYFNNFIQLSAGNKYILSHCLRVALFHNLDFTKK